MNIFAYIKGKFEHVNADGIEYSKMHLIARVVLVQKAYVQFAFHTNL